MQQRNLLLCMFIAALSIQCKGGTKTTIDTNINIPYFKGKDFSHMVSQKGLMYVDVYYEKYKEKENNELGQFRVYMLHKKGGEWYCKNAREKMPGWTEQIGPSAYFGKLLNMKKDTVFKDYNKWAFVIEKKYLKPSIIQEESDFNPSDPTGEIAKNTIRYEVPDGEKYEVILYEQKVGSSKWIELERRKFTIGDKIDHRDWREEFTKKN